MDREPLKPEHLKARLIRALSGLSREQMSEETGIPPSLIGQFEQGQVLPGEEHLARMARCSGFEGADADELMRHFQTQRRTWIRRGGGAGAILENLVQRLRFHCTGAFERLLKLSVPVRPPAPGDRRQAEEQFLNLKRLSLRSKLAAVSLIEEYQNRALAERCREESERQASSNPRRAEAWAQVALKIAQAIPGREN